MSLPDPTSPGHFSVMVAGIFGGPRKPCSQLQTLHSVTHSHHANVLRLYVLVQQSHFFKN